MKWTRERPKGSGWYWIDQLGIIEIVWVQFWGGHRGVDVLMLDDIYNSFNISEFNREETMWAGPIPEPEDE